MKNTTPLMLSLLALLPLVGCTDSSLKQTYLEDSYIDRAPTGTMDAANNAYQAGDFQAAYANARPIADDYLNPRHLEAAYIAGLSAHRLGDLRSADWLLQKAMTTDDIALKADAAAQLGLVYSAQGRYPQAQQTLLWAVDHLQGESKAQAFYYAGIAQQKQGQWSQARATLYNALRHTTNPNTQQQIQDQLDTAGWTLQVGAFTQPNLANDAAQNIADDASRMGLGAPRLIEARDERGRLLTLVQVGTFTSYQSAARYRDNLGTTVIIKPIGQ